MVRIIESVSFESKDLSILNEIKTEKGLLSDICKKAIREWKGVDLEVGMGEENIAFVHDQDDIDGKDGIYEMIDFYLTEDNKILVDQDHDDTDRRDQVLENHRKHGILVEKQEHQRIELFAADVEYF